MWRWSLLALVACGTDAPPAPAASPIARDATPPGNAATVDSRGKVIVTESDECGLVIDNIYFAAGKTTIAPDQMWGIDGAAHMLLCLQRTHEMMGWQVIGHADARERDPSGLAQARAKAVVDAMVARGVAPATLQIVNAAATQPLDRADTAFGHSKNSAVTFGPIR